MKKSKLFICSVIVLMLLLNIISCNLTEEPADISTTPEITDESITEPAPPIFANAEELYNLLMESKPVWERENMIKGTLIDLDFDGTPEFLLMSGGFSPSLTIFRFDGDILEEIKHIQSIYVPESYQMDFRAILPYTDENGKKAGFCRILNILGNTMKIYITPNII